MASSHQSANAEVIAKIEAMIETIVDTLLNEENPNNPTQDIFILLKNKKRVTSDVDTSASPDAESSDGFTKICFPARGRPEEARRFTIILGILDRVHEALYNNTVISKRNIYYQDPELFKNQQTVSHYVDRIAYTFGVSRIALNVAATAKGLVAGNFILTRPDGTQACSRPDAPPHLIDNPHQIQEIDISNVAWILVVEKDSTFRTLVSANLHRTSRAGNGIILTAKGFPDVSTRFFLHLLSTSHNLNSTPPPIYALTDFNPDGLAIMSTYKYGSLNRSHESATLNAPSIQWLGVRSRDVFPGNEGQGEYNGLQRLSARDRKKATDMLARGEGLQDGGTEAEWRRELQVMLMLNVKAQMEILAQREGGVTGWVEEKLLESRTSFPEDEDLFQTHHLANMTLDEDHSPGLQVNEHFSLDKHETPDEVAVGEGGFTSLQADAEMLDTYQMAEDVSSDDESSHSLEWDEEL